MLMRVCCPVVRDAKGQNHFENSLNWTLRQRGGLIITSSIQQQAAGGGRR